MQRQSNGEFITLSRELGGGGEGTVYAVAENSAWVAKIYHQITLEMPRKLAVMYANPPKDPLRSQGHVSIAWPEDLLLERGRVVGFLMARADGGFPLHTFYTPASRRDRCPLFNYLYLYRTARNLAAAVSNLHARGYVIGDVNESNILVSPTALVTLVDTDSFQVCDTQRRHLYPCPVGKPDFTPPELQGKTLREVRRLPEHDRFGLAVLIFQLLMEGTHPFAGVYSGQGDPPPIESRIARGHFPYGMRSVPYRPMPVAPSFEILTPELQRLFVRCFETGHENPKLRPEAQIWVQALEGAERQLVTCSENPQHRYGRHLAACPWCDRKQKLRGRDPFPPTVREAGRLQQQPMPKPKRNARRRTAAGLSAVPAIAYTVRFPQPTSVPRVGAVGWGDSLLELWEDLLKYKYDLLAGGAIVMLAMAGGIYISNRQTPGEVSDSGTMVLDTTASEARLAKPSATAKPRLSAPTERLYTHRDRIEALAVSPDGARFASSSQDGSIVIWSAATRLPVRSRRLSAVLQRPEDRVRALAFGADGTTLVSATARELQVWDVETFELREAIPLSVTPTAIAISDRRTEVLPIDRVVRVGGGSEWETGVWNVSRGGELPLWSRGDRSVVGMSADGKSIATVGESIEIWDIEEGQKQQTLDAKLTETAAIAFDPNGQFVAVSVPQDDGEIQLWDLKTGEVLHSVTASHVSALAFGSDGQTLIAGDLYGSIGIFNIDRIEP
ncbi:hypothetical protein [Baaleninema sp.]|uniref:hypothetical protein n=1 Tax=Baaleninema sp. TaxID=3101197 RepID=UPI003D001ADA